jgi:CheY-like chemotaxis protein
MRQLQENRRLAPNGPLFVVSSDIEPSNSQVAPLESRAIPVRRTGAPKKVLVVEDNLDSVQVLVLLLRDMGHHVVYAINGNGALEVARHMRPDFVLLDLGLPGIDGFEVCHRMKADPLLKAARVIALTAYGDEKHRIRSRAVGCEMHLLKPVSPRALEELLG